MTIKSTEVGKVLNYGTFFDLSANTSLALKLVSPTGVITILTDPRVTAPAVPSTGPSGETFNANEYMQITTIATDFLEDGDYTICGTYTDAAPSLFYGDDAILDVEPAC